MPKLYKYKIYCETEQLWKNTWVEEGADLPTLCPHDSTHTIAGDSGSVDQIVGEEPQKDSEGAVVQRTKIAAKGWKAQFHAIRVTTATAGGVYNKDKDGNDLGFCTYAMYDAANAITTDIAQCVKTVVIWEPTHDMEIVGGRLLQRSFPPSDMLLYVTAAAHIPAAYGGSIAFAEGGINLSDVPAGGAVDFDGRAAKYIQYDPINHSGRFEIMLKHAAGVQHSISLIFEIFKP